MSFLSLANEMVNMEISIRERGKFLESLGFRLIDALHIAAAEKGQVEVLLTCNDKLIKTA